MGSKLAKITALALLGSSLCFSPVSAHTDDHNEKDSSKGEFTSTRITEGLQSNIRIKGAPILRSTLKERMAHHRVPGVSIAFLQDNKVLWTHTEGVVDYITQQPVNKETVFQAASISKPVFATVLMKYRQQHGLDLDADINSLLTSWKLPTHQWAASHPVTLRRLLSHSAGTTVHGFGGYAVGEMVPSITEVLNGAKPANSAAVVVNIQPGSQFRYSGGGTTVAQLALQDVSGMGLPEMAQSTLFGPLGMMHSRYTQPLDADLAENAAVPYNSKGEPVEGGAHTYATLAAAGLWTTPSDLLLFANQIQQSAQGAEGSFLDRASATEMLTPQMKPVGIGFFLRGDDAMTAFGHGGANAGFRADLFAHINSADGIAIMTNSDNGGALINEIKNRAAEIYDWSEISPTIKTVAPYSQDLQNSLVGSYQIRQPIQATLTIRAEGKGVVINMPEYIDNVAFHIESPEKIFALNGMDVSVIRTSEGAVEKLKLWGTEAVKVNKN